jgi:serine/threonine protein kinase
MILQGKTGSYSFNPSDKSSVLRANGKFGSTYIGNRESDGMKVVIKQLNPGLKSDSKAVERFICEGRLDDRIPGLLKIFEWFEQEGEYYLVREYFEGTDLRSFAQTRPIKLDEVIKIFVHVCMTLDGLHLLGVIHRDVRPANILVGNMDEFGEMDGQGVRLIDLGLARFPDHDKNEKSPFALIYSPPEQVMNCGAAVNATSDLYSLGVTLYECIAGKVPFQHQNPEMMMQLMINMPLERDKKIPGALWEVIAKATSKYKFPLPPNKYKKEELVKLMLKGQEGRYHAAREMGADLVESLKEIGRKKGGGFFKRIFGE